MHADIISPDVFPAHLATLHLSLLACALLSNLVLMWLLAVP